MANSYKSSVYLKNAVYRPTSVGDDLNIVASVTIPNGTGLGSGDLLYFLQTGENTEVKDFTLEVPDCDTGTTMTFNFGNTNSATAFLSASTVAQAGGEIIRRSTDATAGNQFATTPYAIQTTVQSVFVTVGTAPTGNPATDRIWTLDMTIWYPISDQELIGLTGVSSTNLLGTKVFANPIVYTYQNQAP